MKTKYILLACALAAAVAVGMAQGKLDDNGAGSVAGPKKTVELIFKTPPNGVLLKGDPARSEQSLIATVDTSSYRRIRVMARSVKNEITDATVEVHESELDGSLGAFSGYYGTHVFDVPGTMVSVRGAVSPAYAAIPIRVVIYGER